MRTVASLGKYWEDFYLGATPTREHALVTLSAAPSPAVLPHLLAALRDPDLLLVVAACKIVAARGTPEAYPILEELAAQRYRGYAQVSFNAAIAETLAALPKHAVHLAEASPGQSAESWLAAYSVASPTQQAELLLKLAALPASPATQALARTALDSEEPLLRLAAIYALGRLCPQDAATLLTPQLRAPLPAVRAAALRALHAATTRPTLETLTPLLQDPSHWVRTEAIALLGTYRGWQRLGTPVTETGTGTLLRRALLPEAETALINLTAPCHPLWVRRAALAVLDGPRSMPVLAQVLKSESAPLQRLALFRLAQFGTPVALTALRNFCAQLGPLTELARYALACILQRQNADAAVALQPAPAVLSRLQNVSERAWVIQHLSNLGAAAASELRAVLQEATFKSKPSLCYALGLVGDVEDIEPLLDLRDAYPPELSAAAGSALLALGERVLHRMVGALSSIPTAVGPEPLVEALGDGQALLLTWAALRDRPLSTPPGVDKAALLAKLEPARDYLVDGPLRNGLLKDRCIAGQCAAADLLGWLGDTRAAPWLMARWQHPRLRSTIALALARLRAGAAFELLTEGLRDHDPLVRSNAAWALVQIDPVRSRELLEQQLAVEEHGFVRAWLRQACVEITLADPLPLGAATLEALPRLSQRLMLETLRAGTLDQRWQLWQELLAERPTDAAEVRPATQAFLALFSNDESATPAAYPRLMFRPAEEPHLFFRRTPPPPPEHPNASWALSCSIAGAVHQSLDDVRLTLTRATQLTLRREPDNVYDVNAILVLAGASHKLGYIPRAQNSELAARMDAGGQAFAVWDCDPQQCDIQQWCIHVYYEEPEDAAA